MQAVRGPEIVGAFDLIIDGDGALLEGNRLLRVAPVGGDPPQPLETARDVDVFRAQNLLPHPERPLMQALGLLVLLLIVSQTTQVVDGRGRVRMLRAGELLGELQHTLQEGAHLVVPAILPEDAGVAVECLAQGEALAGERFLDLLEPFLGVLAGDRALLHRRQGRSRSVLQAQLIGTEAHDRAHL